MKTIKQMTQNCLDALKQNEESFSCSEIKEENETRIISTFVKELKKRPYIGQTLKLDDNKLIMCTIPKPIVMVFCVTISIILTVLVMLL